MICSSVNRDFLIVRLLSGGLYSKLEEFQGLRSVALARHLVTVVRLRP